METSTNVQSNTAGRPKSKIRIILEVIVPLILAFIIIPIFFGGSSSAAKKTAESFVKKDVYSSLGIVADTFSSEVIYKNGSSRLIVVKFGVGSKDWMGAYCVYTEGKRLSNSTTMMPPGYDFEENIEQSKALFGL